MEWTREKDEKRWVQNENTMSDTRLGRIISIPPQYRALGENTHAMTQNVLRIWDLIHKQGKWKYNSPLTPLKETNFFTPGKAKLDGAWIKNENAQLKDITEKRKICTIQGLKHKTDLLVINEWRNDTLSQLCHNH